MSAPFVSVILALRFSARPACGCAVTATCVTGAAVAAAPVLPDGLLWVLLVPPVLLVLLLLPLQAARNAAETAPPAPMNRRRDSPRRYPLAISPSRLLRSRALS